MNDAEFKARRSHLASQNVMTADNPPADDIQALEEQYVDEYTNKLMEDLYSSPERMQEYILESNYENTRMLHACKVLGKAIQNRSPTCADITLKMFIAFFEEIISEEAKNHMENL